MSEKLSGGFYRWQFASIILSIASFLYNAGLVSKIDLISIFPSIKPLFSAPFSQYTPVVMSLGILIFWILFLLDWNLLEDNLKRNISIKIYFSITSALAWLSIIYFLFLEVLGFKNIPINNWNWYGISLLVVAGIILGKSLSSLLSALLLIRVSKDEKIATLPMIPRVTKAAVILYLPVIVLYSIAIFLYGSYDENPLNKCWFYLSGVPCFIISVFSFYGDFKKDSRGISFLNTLIDDSNLTDHMAFARKRTAFFPSGKNARERTKNLFKNVEFNLHPTEEIILTPAKDNPSLLLITPKGQNKDSVSLNLSISMDGVIKENKIIDVPCKYLKLYSRNIRNEEKLRMKLNKVYKIALLEMEYENQSQIFSISALNQAIFSGDIDIVTFYIEKNADINSHGHGGWTPVLAAAAQGHYTILECLLKAGGNPNMQNLMGTTALMHAAKHNDLKIVKLLIEYGADLNIQDYQGFTALMRAIENQAQDVAKCLISKGTNTTKAFGGKMR